MTPEARSDRIPVTAAVCGLCCDACSIFIGSQEEPKRLEMFASRMGWSVEEAHCDGCRAEARTPYCKSCKLLPCAESRGLSFCGECSDYPCGELQTFQRERPHRAELYESLERIAEVGSDTWLREAKKRHSCTACGALNSAYDLKCRKCGHEPGSDFVAAHREAVIKALASR